MKLKQTALDFDFTGEPQSVSPPVQPKETPIVVREEPIEVDIQPKRSPKPPKAVVKSEKKSTRGRMKISDMALEAEKIDIPSDEILFSKSYYNIGTVAQMFHVNQSLIRFWANEFDVLKPKKNAKGDRFFRPEDVKNLKLIYHLLRERKYTIEGAKDFLKKSKRADEKFQAIESLHHLKSFLLELKAGL
jgi:DNA-binding transcriptional MerR regulator